MPNVIHLICFGAWPKGAQGEAYLKHVKQWQALNPQYTVKLWSSSSSQTADEYKKMSAFCSSNAIALIDIDTIEDRSHPNLSCVKDWLSHQKLGLSRFAAASDVLRLSLLEKEGRH
ncbi:MAG: hypothetical protein K0U24_01110 [Gammaproteobacteria bacterium]|nr:hypothetical protein [Gammaproteobacteria bacterium]